MIINQTNLINFFKGLRVVFDPAFQAAPAQWMNFAMRTDSGGAEDQYGFLGAVPGMKELLGEVTVANLALHDFTIKNREWHDTIGVKRKDLERDRLGIYTPLTQSMAEAAKQHPDQLLADLIVGGFTNAGLCYDGKPFFAVGHLPKGADPKKGGTYTNLRHSLLTPDSYDAARTRLRSRKNAEGRSLKLGRKLALVVGPKNETNGKRILQADYIAQTAQAAGAGAAAGQVAVASAAVSNVNKGTAELQVWPELGAANENAWLLMEQGYTFRPFIVQYEVEPRNYAVTNENDSHVVLNQEFLYQVYARYNAGYGMPELIEGSDGTGAADPA